MNKQEELLVITMEECGELVQACSKVIRNSKRKRFIKNFKEEIGDVALMIELLKINGLITEEEIQERMTVKTKKLEKWSNVVR